MKLTLRTEEPRIIKKDDLYFAKWDLTEDEIRVIFREDLENKEHIMDENVILDAKLGFINHEPFIFIKHVTVR